METFMACNCSLYLSYVLILPMRNGNIFCLQLPTLLDFVLILPMRNGNRLKMQKLEKKILVLILPMRNGNYRPEYYQEVGLESSYPTYEEWKPNQLEETLETNKGSYPTYEEWKLLKPQILLL